MQAVEWRAWLGVGCVWRRGRALGQRQWAMERVKASEQQREPKERSCKSRTVCAPMHNLAALAAGWRIVARVLPEGSGLWERRRFGGKETSVCYTTCGHDGGVPWRLGRRQAGARGERGGQ